MSVKTVSRMASTIDKVDYGLEVMRAIGSGVDRVEGLDYVRGSANAILPQRGRI